MTIVLNNLPASIDKALHQKAATEGRSVYEVATEAMARGLGVAEGGGYNGSPPKMDLSDIVGTMTEEDARAIEESVRWRENGEGNGGGPIRVEITGPPQRDLSDIAGTWVDDPEFDEAMKDFERIDPE